MYFAVEPTSADIPAQIAQVITTLQEQHSNAPFHIVALVDCAFDEQFFKSGARSHWHRHSMYAGTPLESLGSASPYLTAHRARMGNLSQWLTRLFSDCNGRPMLSIVASAVDVHALQRHLKPYLICRTDDTVEWPIRWGDTRVLPGLIDSLTPTQSAHLLAPLYGWWSVSRDGTLSKWHGGGDEAPQPAAFDKLPMPDHAFSALVDCSEADAVLASIYESQPDLLRGVSPLQAHSLVSKNLRLATEHRVDAAAERHHLSVLALLYPRSFADPHPVVEALRKVQRGAAYFDEIAKIPEQFWEIAN